MISILSKFTWYTPSLILSIKAFRAPATLATVDRSEQWESKVASKAGCQSCHVEERSTHATDEGGPTAAA